jgi:hypothetical protein
MFTSLLGLPLFPWTPAKASALGDANASNFRYRFAKPARVTPRTGRVRVSAYALRR